MEYTRKKLIEISKNSRVEYGKWNDRDSCSAQTKAMLCRLLLESGCGFKVIYKANDACITDEWTVWLEIYYAEWEDGEQWHTFYLPSEKKIKECNGADWY